MLNGVAEFIVKGKNRMPALEIDWWEFVIPLVKLGWLPWIGAAIFFWGWIHQLRCHAILVGLTTQYTNIFTLDSTFVSYLKSTKYEICIRARFENTKHTLMNL